MAVLLKHHGLVDTVLNTIEGVSLESSLGKPGLPRAVAEVCRNVYQARRTLIKVSQLMSLSVCLCVCVCACLCLK